MTPAPGTGIDRELVGDAEKITPDEYVDRARGHLLIQSVGPKIGRLTLHPRFVRQAWDADRFKLLLLDREEAIFYFRREVLRHNEPILDALVAADLAGGGAGVPDGGIAAALRRLSRLVRNI